MISIVIPTFNGSKHIANCYNSLVSQTNKDWQAVFVNDGSTDDSNEKLESIAKIDSRIKIITQPNSGVAVAREIGLLSADGEYVTFLDIDDTLTPDAINIIQTLFESSKADILVTGVNIVENNSSKETIEYNDSIVTGEELFRLMSVGKIRWQLWAKAYKKALFSSIKHPRGIISGEDMAVCMQVASKAEIVAISRQITYNYIQEESSATHSKNPRLAIDPIKAAEIVEKQICTLTHSKRYLNSVKCLFLLCVSSCMRSTLSENRKLITDTFDKHFTWKNIRMIPLKKSISLLLYRYLGINLNQLKQ